ncbi:MAG: glucosyl-3-phosphoglycerate synthase [Actinomycetota bacterium]|nr:glucosyl-3-phosphoglycerate synthase [Actinomycetota bacterium]
MSVPTGPMRTFDHRHYRPSELARVKEGRCVTVCLPARDEAATVGLIVGSVMAELHARHGLVDEVVVVDDGSVDGTAELARSAGARVVPAHGTGKGAAMQKGLQESRGDLVVFCDADLRHFDPCFVVGLVGPLFTHEHICLVKGCYDRPYGSRWGEGGRVTELVAKPLLRTLLPHLSWLGQPLAGECAGRRDVLEQVPFVTGYGVDIALVIDVFRRFGAGAVAQADLGRRFHRNRPLEELGPQAEAVIRTVLARAGLGEPVAACPPLVDQQRLIDPPTYIASQ